MAPEGLRSRLSGSVPVSIVVHLVLLLVLVVIPLANDVIAPIPWRTAPSYVLAAPLPPPPPAPPAHTPPSTYVDAGNPAPTHAPDHIAREVVAPPALGVVGVGDTGLPGVGVDTGGLGLIPANLPPAPPAPPVQQGPIRAAQLPELPRKIVDVRPQYPEIARSARVEGTVVLEAVLDASGRITQLRVLRSVPLLDQAALDAVRQWRYTPSTYNGRAVSVLMTVTVHFSLQQ